MGDWLAPLAGVAVMAGLVLLARGLTPTTAPPTRARGRSLTQRWARATRRPAGPAGRRRDAIVLAAVVAGVVVSGLTGWVLAIVLVPVLALALPALLRHPPNRDVVLLEALDRWVRTLAATIPTGKSVLEAIRVSQRTAPASLAGGVALLAARIDSRWTARDALTALADELDSPDADTVLGALILAAERGGTGATTTLTELSESIQSRLTAMREIEAERAKPRVVVRQVTLITVVVLGLALVFGGGFFEPYRSPLGQGILAVLVGAYLAALFMLRRLTDPPPRARILVREGP